MRRIVSALVPQCVVAKRASAQDVEVVSDEVWLGGQLFTIDDLEGAFARRHSRASLMFAGEHREDHAEYD